MKAEGGGGVESGAWETKRPDTGESYMGARTLKGLGCYVNEFGFDPVRNGGNCWKEKAM